MSSILLDLRAALRSLRATPWFTLVATVSLALAIGLNSVVFGIINGILLRPLATVEADRLVRIGATRQGEGFFGFSYPEYLDLRDMGSLDGLLGHYPNTVAVSVAGDPQTEWIEVVSGNYFAVLGVTPVRGRAFTPEEDRTPLAAPVVVVSHRLWQRRLGGRDSAVGRSIKVNGRPFTVIGIAPEGFRGTFAGFGVDIWVPVMMSEAVLADRAPLTDRSSRFLMVVGRARRGSSRAAVRAEAAVMARQWTTAQPRDYQDFGIAVTKASGVHPFIAGLVTAFLALLQGIVALVLLIACANLAGLLLTRSLARRRELAVRAALGAGRGALVRHLVTESVILAAPGALGGILLAHWVTRLLARYPLPVGVPVALDFSLDVRVVLFALAAAGVTVLVAGVWPAWRVGGRPELLGELRVAGATVGQARVRVRSVLVATQVAVAAVLLLNADLLVQSLRRSRLVDPGFDPANVLVLYASPEQLGYDEPRARAFWRSLRDRAAALPGVQSAALALFVPLGDRGDLLTLGAADREEAPLPRPYNYVSPGYFALLRIPILAGRNFLATDDHRAPGVAIVTVAAAERLFGDPRPIGRPLRIVDREGRERRVAVVGVVGNVKIRTLGEAPQPMVYLASDQWYRPDMMLHLRLTGQVPAIASLQATSRAIEPELPVRIRTMLEETGFSLIPVRIAGQVLGVAGFLGLGLALVGVFGVVAYAVSQRKREMGIRMALGAQRRQIQRLVMAQGLRPVGAGLLIGLAVAFLASGLLRGLLIEVGPLNPETLVAVPAFLLLAGGAASLLPARRATRLDPASVLRTE